MSKNKKSYAAKPVSKPENPVDELSRSEVETKEFTNEEKEVLNGLKARHAVITKDPMQDNLPFKEFALTKLNYLIKSDLKNVSRAKDETPRKLEDSQKIMIAEMAKKYVKDIEVLSSIVEKL